MYKVIIIEDDPMVASINKQYVELTSFFTWRQLSKTASLPCSICKLHG